MVNEKKFKILSWLSSRGTDWKNVWNYLIQHFLTSYSKPNSVIRMIEKRTNGSSRSFTKLVLGGMRILGVTSPTYLGLQSWHQPIHPKLGKARWQHLSWSRRKVICIQWRITVSERPSASATSPENLGDNKYGGTISIGNSIELHLLRF